MANDRQHTFDESTVSGDKIIVVVNLSTNKLAYLKLENSLDFGTLFPEKTLFMAKDIVETLRRCVIKAYEECGQTAPIFPTIPSMVGSIDKLEGIELKPSEFERASEDGQYYELVVNRDPEEQRIQSFTLIDGTNLGGHFIDISLSLFFDNVVNMMYMIQQAYIETGQTFEGWIDLNPVP